MLLLLPPENSGITLTWKAWWKARLFDSPPRSSSYARNVPHFSVKIVNYKLTIVIARLLSLCKLRGNPETGHASRIASGFALAKAVRFGFRNSQ